MPQELLRIGRLVFVRTVFVWLKRFGPEMENGQKLHPQLGRNFAQLGRNFAQLGRNLEKCPVSAALIAESTLFPKSRAFLHM